MTELRHFNDYGYPGDATLGLPEFQDEPPLDNIYYLDLGLDLNQTNFDKELDKIAEYVYLNSFSKCSVFFDECRKLDEDAEHFSLRTFGLSICGPSNPSQRVISNSLAKELIHKWGQGSAEPDEIDDKLAEKWFKELDLHFDGISNTYADQFDELIGDERFAAIGQQIKDIANSDSYQRAEELESFFDEVFGAPRARKDVGHVDPEICDAFDENVSHDALEIGEQISLSTLKLMESDKLDIGHQLRIIGACNKKLAVLQKRFDKETRCCNDQLQQLMSTMREITPEQSKSKPDKAELMDQGAESYYQFRIQEFILRYSKEHCRAIGSSLTSTRTMLEKFKNQLDMIANSFSAEEVLSTSGADELNMEQLMLNSILENRNELIELAEKQVYQSLIISRGGFLEIFNETTSWQKHLPSAIRLATRNVLSESLKKISLDKIVADNQITGDQLLRWLNEMLNVARPRVCHCGGGSRALVGLPQQSETTSLVPVIANQFSVTSAQISGTTGELVFCFEGEDISLANVAYRLLEQRPDASQLAKRIHTRSDIEWSSLDDLL